MWDLVTLDRLNDAHYCDWLAKRLCAELSKSGIAVSDDVRRQVEVFVRTLPTRVPLPVGY